MNIFEYSCIHILCTTKYCYTEDLYWIADMKKYWKSWSAKCEIQQILVGEKKNRNPSLAGSRGYADSRSGQYSGQSMVRENHVRQHHWIQEGYKSMVRLMSELLAACEVPKLIFATPGQFVKDYHNMLNLYNGFPVDDQFSRSTGRVSVKPYVINNCTKLHRSFLPTPKFFFSFSFISTPRDKHWSALLLFVLSFLL
jgi:hypothetical protein